jgi:hypothetical protein|tara:strand:- start:339 stop:758 length:420 start_codon:yes stop_codon:yes gene_type:complete
MANQRIEQLPIVTAANSASVVPIVQAGVTSQIAVTDLTNEYIRKAEHVVSTISTTQTINLSTTVSVNILVVANPGLTLTIQFPTSPVESQVCEFTTLTNTVTLVPGSGTFQPSFAGAPVAGYNATYVYHLEETTWYLIG